MKSQRPMDQVSPVRVKRVNPGQIDIEWRDDHLSQYPTRYLRGNCGCAHCVDERTGKRMVFEENIPEGITYREVQLVGNYAMSILFDDDHSTGIYSWDWLRDLCPCTDCKKD